MPAKPPQTTSADAQRCRLPRGHRDERGRDDAAGRDLDQIGAAYHAGTDRARHDRCAGRRRHQRIQRRAAAAAA